MLRNKFLSAVLLAASVSVGIWGCAQAPYDLNVTQSVAANPVTAFGKVIDAQTRQGIGGATVYIKVNGNWQSTTTSTGTTVKGETGGAGDSVAGEFTISGLPVNTFAPIIIKGPADSGLLQFAGNIQTQDYTANAQGVNTKISQDLGQIQMEKGIVATVYVVDANTGGYVTKSDSSALPIYVSTGLNGAPGVFNVNGSVEDVMAARDTTDTNKYTITIPQSGSTSLIIPALDTTADGKYDYQTGTRNITSSGGLVTGVGTLTTTIALAPITNSTAPTLVASNIRTAGANSGSVTSIGVIGKSDPIKLLFNMPVALPATAADSVTLSFNDTSFKVLSATVLVDTNTEVAVTAALSAGNTLLTVTPSAALTEGQRYTLNGTVTSSAQTGAADTVYTLANINAAGTFTVTQTGTGTIGSTPTVAIDNQNNCTNGTTVTFTGDTYAGCVAGLGGQARLIFPEPVWGTVQVTKIATGPTATAVTTSYNAAPVVLTGQGLTYYANVAQADAFNANQGLNRASGPVYVSNDLLLANQNDHSATFTNIYTLAIDAYDADGNTMRTETTYNVQ